MGWMILKMAPKLIWNQLRHGRSLDLLVTHSPPRHVNDREDIAHRGFRIMRRFLRWFRPAYQLHGHVHHYDRSQPNTVRYIDTDVINVFPYQRLELAFDALCDAGPAPSDAPAADLAAPEVNHQP
jgi:hypothetical protein